MNILIEKFKQRNEISTIFLYILYFLLGMYYPLFSFMRQTVPQYWNQVTLFYHILLILLLVKVILQKNSVLDCFFLIVLLYLCYKSYQYNYDFYNIFGTMMFLCCAKNIEIKKIVKLDLYVRIVRSALFLTLPFMGLMINKINVWIGGRTRTFFGYAGFIIFLDLTANSRTAEAVIAMLIVIHLLSIVIPKNWFHKMMVLFTSGAFLLCVCIPFIGSYLYIRKPELFLQHDGTMLSRIQLTTTFYLRNGGVGFYGFPIEDEDCLDMMFSYIGLHWGIAAFIVIVAAITYAIYKASSEQNTVFLVLLFSFLVYGWAEVAPIYPVYSYFSLLLGYYIMNHKPFSLHIKGKTIAF